MFLKWFVLIALGCSTLIQNSKVLGVELNWTRSGIANYKPNSPLTVSAGVKLKINCINDSYSTIYVLTNRRQYDMCNCSAIEAGCVSSQLVSGTCFAQIRFVEITINHNSQGLDNSFDYRPGETYYYASFPHGTKEGGPCFPTNTEPGMRMAIAIQSEETEPPTTMETTDHEMNSQTSDIPTLIDHSTDDDLSTDLGLTEKELEIPIGGIVGGVIVAVIFIIIVSGALILFFWRHGVHKQEEVTTVESPLDSGYYDASSPGPTISPSTFTEGSAPTSNGISMSRSEDYSNSFRQYEVMKDRFQGSQSSLIVNPAIQGKTEGEQYEEVAVVESVSPELDASGHNSEKDSDTTSEEERINTTSEEERITHKHNRNEEQEHTEASSLTDPNIGTPDKTCSPRPGHINIPSDDKAAMDNDENLISLETPTARAIPKKLALSPKSSVTSFTNLAIKRAGREVKEEEAEAAMDSPLEVDQLQDVFEEDKASHEPIKTAKPQPTPRKLKSQSLEDLTKDEESPKLKPKAKPRTGKKYEDIKILNQNQLHSMNTTNTE